jgi:amino acid transporter
MIRGVGLRSAVAINVATMVGAGPFITLPLVVAALHGSVSAAGWVVGALIALCDGLVWAELASRYPRSGGTYTYLREAFGPRGPGRFVAFLFVWQFLFWAPLILASGYIGFAQYAAYLVPALGGFVPTHLLAVGVGIVTLASLYRAIPQIARTALVLGAVALATLLVVAFAGLTHPFAPIAHTIPATLGFPPGLGPLAALGALGGALVITLYDYGGYGDVCALGDEVIAPVRTIPLAVVLSVLFVGVAYVLLNLGVAVAVPAKEIAASTAIASLVAERASGAPFAIAVTLAVLITAFGSTYGLLLGASRIPYAAARDGDFLPAFARLHPSGRFPAVSLIAIGLLALPASLFPLDVVINALTAGIVLVQGVGQVVALVAARRSGRAPFRIPLYPLPPLIALIGWLYLFWSTGATAITFGLVTLAIGAGVFLVRARVSRIWPFAAASVVSLLALACIAGTAIAAPATPSFGHAAIVQRDGEPRLLVDGKPFFFWGGAFFYERIPADGWRTSMLAMRALGANTLDLYVPWNWHELADGDFDFDGRTDPRRNLREVLRLGKDLGFHFIVRPGPVIRNEWRNGGYPAWLLTRPEYDMPLHDVLEGRYPATATLQNASSDDAAAEWMRNPTHLRYASRWLHRALEEFRPYADRVIAVQLDDDQGAYITNQTYPAPNFHRYLGWLEAQVRDVIGPTTPAFINTYQMRVPSSSPVWTMGNWYQSDAYSVGLHDRVELDFSTLLLATNRRGPLAQSEFQAGWLAGAEDPAPRAADPRNTILALDELLALGAKGIIDFPLQDTAAEPGWEAPFSNAEYTWDAALRENDDEHPQPAAPRYGPTRTFGIFIARFAQVVLSARRAAPIGIAYGEPPPRADSRPPVGAGPIVARVRSALGTCLERGEVCDVIDLAAPARVARYATIVLAPEVAAAVPDAVRRLRAAGARGARIVSAVPPERGPGTTTLAGPDGRLTFGANWSDAPVSLRFGRTSVVVAPHSVELRLDDVALSALGATGDARRLSADCPVAAEPGPIERTLLVSPRGCRVTLRDGARTSAIALAPGESLSLPGLQRTRPPIFRPGVTSVEAHFHYTEPVAAATVTVSTRDDGGKLVLLANDRTHITIDASAGSRAFSLFTPSAPAPELARFVRAMWAGVRPRIPFGPGVFDATGALRDDLTAPLPLSQRDYIAPYTHAYPAGTFNRTYAVEVLASGKCAAVRFTYTMPDADPPGVTFERIVSLEPGTARVVVDERLVFPAGAATTQRTVVRSSLPILSNAVNAYADAVAVPLDAFPRDRAGTVPEPQNGVGGYLGGVAFVVAWPPGDVEQAVWTPYLSTGTLALTLAPGWRRTTYAAELAAGPAAARAFAEAERAWVAANRPPSSASGEVAKWYTQSPQKRPSESSCGFESHLP